MDRVAFGRGRLAASVNAQGAELQSLRADGREVMWQAGPAWPRHAPVLFPIVGRLSGDTLRYGGLRTRLTQHGFARDRMFEVVEHGPDGCTLALRDDEATRAVYPFRFRISLTYRIADDALTVEYRVENPAETDLFASLGAHPAFRWPLVDGVAKEAHRIVFEADERVDLLRLRDGLVEPDRVGSPVRERVLGLSDEVFAGDALIFEPVASRSVRYQAPGLAVTVGWEGFSALGIWSKPADFVCIEPWSGWSDPVGYAGDFTDKPGVVRVPPGDEMVRRLSIGVT